MSLIIFILFIIGLIKLSLFTNFILFNLITNIYLISNYQYIKTPFMNPNIIMIKLISIVINIIKININFAINYYIESFSFINKIYNFYNKVNSYFVWFRGYLFKKIILNPLQKYLNLDLLSNINIKNEKTFKDNIELNSWLDKLVA